MLKRFLLIYLLLSSLSLAAQEGSWSGELLINLVNGTKLPLVFNFSADGCTFDSPSQGAKGIPTQWTRSDNGKVKVLIPAIGASYEGQLNDTVITGLFKQGTVTLPLTLTQGVKKTNRPQTPTPPFPYTTEEVSFVNGSLTLYGTLTLPKGSNRDTPLLVMVTGSGLQNRDEELFEHKPFAVIADALARKGFATYRYDDRGLGNPSFPTDSLTTLHFKSDALAAVNQLRKRFNRIGIIGHSEGGTIAMMLAAEGRTDFVVSLAGMAISGKTTLLLQNEALLKANGVPHDAVGAYCKSLEAGFDQVLAGKQPSEIVAPELPAMFKSSFDAAMRQAASPYIRQFLTIDASSLLPHITCPVLALNGRKDTQVDCDSNLGALEKGLSNCKHQVVALDGLNHLFQHCDNGTVQEYGQIEETFATQALEVISAWLIVNTVGKPR